MDVPSGWVQIIRGPRPPSQRWPKSSDQKPTIGRWRNHQNQEVKVPTMPRQVRVGPSAARDLAKNKIVQLERALEAMAGMEGPAEARTASKKPPLNVEIEEARRSMRRLKEMEEERQVEERLLSEAQENLKKMLAEQEKGPSHPAPSQDATSQITDLQQMVNMLQVERDSLVAELSRGRMRRVEKLHPPQSSEEAAENLRERAAKRQACGPEDIPNSEQELTEWMCTKHLELRDALEIGSNELVVEISQLLAKGALAMQAFSVRPSTLSNMVT